MLAHRPMLVEFFSVNEMMMVVVVVRSSVCIELRARRIFLKYGVAPRRQLACGGYELDDSVTNTARVSESRHLV